MIRAPLLMTGEAHLRLLSRRSHGIVDGVNLVTVNARDLVTIMGGIAPGVLQLVGVAAQAGLILARHRCHGVEAKIRDRRAWLTAADTRAMRAARAVARLALQLARCKR